MKAIEVRDLSKVYKGQIRAIDGISFDVDQGIVFGFLGPNGAGKSTTIKILVTLIQASSGQASIFGHDTAKEPSRIRELIGYVPQEISSDGSLTGYENMLLSAKLYDVPANARKKRIEDLLEILELAPRQHDVVKTYSGGMIRRLEIGQAMLHNPKLLFLDEPTLGLDPSGRKLVWQHITKLNEENDITIFLTTHYMEEADSLCDNIGIINKGKIAVVDSPSALKEAVGHGTLTMELDLGGMPGDALSGLQAIVGARAKSITKLSGTRWQFAVPEVPHNAPRIIQSLVEHHIAISALEVKSPTLEDAFLEHTGSKLEDASKEAWRATKGRRRTFRRMG